MIKKLRNSVIVIFAIGVIINLFYNISGTGIIGVIKCSNNYKFTRCLKIGNTSPIILVHDFFTFQGKNKITRAWNLLSKDQQYNFTHQKGGLKDKNYFHHFWDTEVQDFVIFKSSYERIHDQTAEISFKICYTRSPTYLAQHPEKNFPKRFCSNDTYTLIRKQKENSPYLWSIDLMAFQPCSIKDMKICQIYDFSKKYLHFSDK